MAHNSDIEDLNDVNNDSLEFNSEDDNFDDFLDDECKPTPMNDNPPLNRQFGNVQDANQSEKSISNNNNNVISNSQNAYNIGNGNNNVYTEQISQKPFNAINNENDNVSLSVKSSGGGLKLLNKGLISKNSQNFNQNNINLNSDNKNYSNNENSSTNFMNKSEISFPPLPSQGNPNLQQQPLNIPLKSTSPRLLQSAYKSNSNDTNGSTQSIPGIPVIESSNGNMDSSIQNSLFTKNENGSTIINFPPLKGENNNKFGQIPPKPSPNLISQPNLYNEKKIINFPPLKGEDAENQQQKMQQQLNAQQKEQPSLLQIPSTNNIESSQTQQPSQIRVSIKPKFLLKQQPQSANKQQVSFNLAQKPQVQQPNQLQNNQQQPYNQVQNIQQQPQSNISNINPQVQTVNNNLQVNQQQPSLTQNVQQLPDNQAQIQNIQQQQEMIPNNKANLISQSSAPNSSFPSAPYLSQPLQQNIPNTYILTPTDRVAISFGNKLDLSLSALKRSIANEISSILRLPYYSSMSSSSINTNQENSKLSLSSQRYSFSGRLPPTFDSDVDTFLDHLNSELLSAVSFSPLLGVNEGSFSASIYGNGLYNNGISPATSANSTEVMNVSNINENNNNNSVAINNAYQSKISQNPYLNMSVNMNFATERYVSFLAQSINNVIDENIKPISSSLAASSIVEQQMCNEQAKSLQKLKNEVSSLRSSFKSGVSQILEKLNNDIVLIESNEREEAKKRKRINRSLHEMRYMRKDLQMQIEKLINEKEKNDIALRDLVARRRKMYIEIFSKNEADMKLNRLIRVIESIDNEIKDEAAIFKSSKSSKNTNYNLISNGMNSNDSKVFSDLADSLEYAEKIMNIDEESMRIHLMESTASNRWVTGNLSAISRLVKNDSFMNPKIGNQSQLQLKYSPSRKAPSAMILSPRRGSAQNSFT
ncbi:hypothetical protein M9Y10_023381 [Tritrichomonas musculus]|uniref:Uncharacterized protein n=1 Tax=Tritrichomonas musculus TaxID=1915356 RepID=A0ABR2KUY9_9EUKA